MSAEGYGINITGATFVGLQLVLAAKQFAHWRYECMACGVPYTEISINCDDRVITLSYDEFVRRVFMGDAAQEVEA
jgi:hypothetical protein